MLDAEHTSVTVGKLAWYGYDAKLFLSFFFNDTATTEIYTLSLHDALPIAATFSPGWKKALSTRLSYSSRLHWRVRIRSEEHTSELQSQSNIVCRLLLE